ncbi:MAG: TPM domain-containing protein [Myxococcota bacterium]
MTRLLFLGVLLALPAWALEIPPPPAGEDYLWDDAGLVSAADELQLKSLQRTSLDTYNSPIVVVTISRVSDYGEASVEALATRWFNAWNIGTLGLEKGANQGILLLVAVEDRRARIELGADWAHDWDAHAQRIMDGTIVPQFKAGNFSRGIVDGVEALLEMAKQGPHSHPPGDFLESKVRPLCKYSLLDPTPFLAMMGLGLVLILLGAFGKTGHSGLLIGAGVALILFAAFSYIIILGLLLVFGRRGGRGGGSGRGFSGGFSGGGGASGSW